ncbi:uncharacterized protein N0V89_011526 [Didymosphaeria variabile]|uniref:DUF7730 domain-containing protein n=1 Tax=Didymosphaeria variabile TaxID=1932322 RepID=A0A9W8XA70_9PLEO|nr:uncharacterized protein N0V89_011526 [Didymosphaeria variabile]KAJ4345396.1 hypothetical protein N0V89_011526 [Didymosphaeria variabile]
MRNLAQPSAERQSIVEANQVNSPLLQLPGEVRNSIYHYVFANEVLRQTRTGPDWRSPNMKFLPPLSFHDRQNPRRPRDQRNWLSLVLVCRQLYVEARILPFQQNAFSITRLRHICPLLRTMHPEQREKITEIQLEVDFVGFDSQCRTIMAGYPEHAVEELDLQNYLLSFLLPSVKRIEVVVIAGQHYGHHSPSFPSNSTRAALEKLESTLHEANFGWTNAEIGLRSATLSLPDHCMPPHGTRLLPYTSYLIAF